VGLARPSISLFSFTGHLCFSDLPPLTFQNSAYRRPAVFSLLGFLSSSHPSYHLPGLTPIRTSSLPKGIGFFRSRIKPFSLLFFRRERFFFLPAPEFHLKADPSTQRSSYPSCPSRYFTRRMSILHFGRFCSLLHTRELDFFSGRVSWSPEF